MGHLKPHGPEEFQWFFYWLGETFGKAYDSFHKHLRLPMNENVGILLPKPVTRRDEKLPTSDINVRARSGPHIRFCALKNEELSCGFASDGCSAMHHTVAPRTLGLRDWRQRLSSNIEPFW